MTITVHNRQRRVRCDLLFLRRLAKRAAEAVLPRTAHADPPLASLEEVGVVILPDREMADVHGRYLDDPRPTDVITFDHGEILIGAETAEANARRFQTTTDREIGLYIVHGLLHLNGFSDRSRSGAERMKRIQKQILSACIRSVCVAMVMGCGAFPALAQVANQDAPPIDMAKMVEAIRSLREQNTASRSQRLDAALRDIREAAATPSASIALYRKVMKLAEEPEESAREEAKRHRNMKVSDIRRRDNAELRDGDLQKAVQLHLQFLAITLERSRSDKPEAFIDPVFQFIQAVDALPKEIAEQEILKGDVTQGPFADYYGMDSWLVVPDKWEGRPVATHAIANQAILPVLRKSKDPRLLSYWDYRIKIAAGQIGPDNPTDSEIFERRTRPSLFWNRAQDMALVGQKNRALGEMFAICKAYPDHPQFGTWLDQLETALGGGAAGETNR
jgi:probable rRNA maturation factor